MTDVDIQDLKRENFNLKLRIYFLEEQGQVNEYQTCSTSVKQLQNENEGPRRCLQTIDNFDFNDERRALHEELNKCRREIDSLRNSLHERRKLPASSVDSGVDVNSVGMSSTSLNNNPFNESKERERKLEENIKTLEKQLESSIALTNDTLADLERARRKIKQYEIEIQNYEQKQSKAERVLHRLQVEYESRIAHLVEQQQQQAADLEAYRHEPLLARIRLSYPLYESTNSNVNIEEYRQAIEDRDRIIQHLEKSINEMTVRLRTPFSLNLPSTDEHSQGLIQELNIQMKIHLETIDQLRAECVELRRGEINLRNQVDSLTQLINTPNRTSEFSSSIRQTTKTIDPIQTAERIEDLQTAVVQITLQLQTDAENISGLTNRVAQIIRDRDEWQEKINHLYDEIEKKNAHIRLLEQREPDADVRQQFTKQIEILQQEIHSLKEQVPSDYEQFVTIHNQERENLQNQLRTATEHLINCEQDLADQRKQYEDLQRKYENIRTSSNIQIEQFEKEIQQQRIYIEEFNQRIRENENHFQLERQQFERERDFEKQKHFDRQNDLERLQLEYNRLQITFDEQIREKDRANENIQNLRRDNQVLRDQLQDLENRSMELNRINNELKLQISVYEVRFQDNEDLDRRYRNEISKLQEEIQEISRENEHRIYEINEWKRRYESIENDSKFQHERIQTENTKLKQEIDELSIKIRLEIQHEYEEQYHQLITNNDTQIHNIQQNNDLEKQRLERNLQQANETIEILKLDIVQLKETLDQYQNKNQQIEYDLSQAFNEEIKRKNERLQILETKLNDLEKEKSKVIEYNTQLQQEYEQYRIEQENNYDILQRNFDDATEKNLTAFEERVRIVTENKQNLIDKLENELREKENIIKDLQNARLPSSERRNLQLDLEIRIEQLEQEVEVKENFIRTYSETVQDKEQQIRQLLDSIQQGDTDKTIFIERLREDLRIRDEKLEEKQRLIHDYEYRLNELQKTLDNINEKFHIQQRELDDYRQKSDINRIDLNIALEENESQLERIKFLEKQLSMSQTRQKPTDQIAHYETMVDDLKSKLRQRDDSIQIRKHRIDTLRNLQRTISDSDRDSKDIRYDLRYQQMEKQLNIEIENRDQTIASLRKKIADKDEEINKLRASDLAKEAEISKFRSRSRESDPDSKSEYSAARAPTNVSLKLDIQKKDEEIERLQKELERVRREYSSNGRGETTSSSIEHARLVNIDRPRISSKRFEHLNREELLYELEMALQDNEGLVQQLAKKTPNITELHNQLLDLRKELARQKYVNQVLWRKLDALIDIQGSNTRAELAIELANYHDELEALKAKQHRVHDTRSVLLNPLSRSSSGLTNPSSFIRQRRFSDEDFLSKSSSINIQLNDIDQSLENKTLEELKDIIRNQKKFLQHIRIHTISNKENQISNTFQQYENIIKQQQEYIDQLHRKTTQDNLDDLIINLDINIIPTNDQIKQTSLNKKDSGVESVIESARYNLTQQQLNDKDEQIKKLTKQLSDLKKAYETELSQYRLQAEQIQTDLIGDLDSKQNDLRQVRQQVDLLKSTKNQLEQAQDQNQRLQNELANKIDLIDHYEKQIHVLEKQISSYGTGDMTVRTSEMSELLEEMRRLRYDLHQSLAKQQELQTKLDENIRLSRTPREFTFSGRGVSSYSDLHMTETSGSGAIETNFSSKIVRSITTDIESVYPTKMYYIGEIETHELVRRLIADLKIEFKSLEMKIKEKLRSKFTSALTEPSIEWLEHRLKTVTLCLTRLEETSELIEIYWKANLPLKNSSNEHPFNDHRLLVENQELKSSQTKYIQELQNIRQRYKEQSIYMDQILAQLTKTNNKKANSDDYLKLLLRPTLDVLQKARSNMENHLKESTINKNFLPESFQSYRRQRLNRLD